MTNKLNGKRPWVLVLVAVALVVGLGFLGGQAQAFDGFPGPTPGDGLGPGTPQPPEPPFCSQECFDDYIENSTRCKALHCDTYFFFLEFCDNPNYGECLAKAGETFDLCLARCPH